MEKDIRDLLAIMARIVHEKGPWKDKQKKVLKIAQETDESFSVFSEFLSLFLDEPKETD